MPRETGPSIMEIERGTEHESKITASHEKPETDQAKRELIELGMETLPENVEMVRQQMRFSQFPDGYDDVLKNLELPGTLKTTMEQKGIKSIVHSEGKFLWDHTRLAIQQVKDLDLPVAQERELKLIILFHDTGKLSVAKNEKNVAATEKALAKGDLHQSMIGHAEADLDIVRAGLKANGFEGDRLEMLVKIVANHMKTSLLEQDPKKTVALFESFGRDDDERKEMVKLLTTVLQLDGNATEHIDLVDGELKYSKNEKKLKLNFESVWRKYEDGKKILQDEIAKKEKAKAETEFEASIFGGKKLSDYLVAERGLKPGPELGKASGKIRAIIAANRDKTSEEIRALVDKTEL